MNAAEFSQFADDLIRELSPHLATVALEFYEKQGRGAVLVKLHDDDDSDQRTSDLAYLKHDHLQPHDPLHKLARDMTGHYDPQRSLVVLIELDEMSIARQVSFGDLARFRGSSSQAAEKA